MTEVGTVFLNGMNRSLHVIVPRWQGYRNHHLPFLAHQKMLAEAVFSLSISLSSGNLIPYVPLSRQNPLARLIPLVRASLAPEFSE